MSFAAAIFTVLLFALYKAAPYVCGVAVLIFILACRRLAGVNPCWKGSDKLYKKLRRLMLQSMVLIMLCGALMMLTGCAGCDLGHGCYWDFR